MVTVNSLTTHEIEVLDQILNEAKSFLANKFLKNFPSKEKANLIFCFLLVKKNIYLKLQERVEYKLLAPWLKLHEILMKEKAKNFHHNTFQKNIFNILKQSDLFNTFSIKDILSVPSEFLRAKFLINSALYSPNLKKKVFEVYSKCYKKGLMTNGRKLEGLLAALSYLCSVKMGLKYTQIQFSKLFGTNAITLRKHIPEIIKIVPEYRVIKKQHKIQNLERSKVEGCYYICPHCFKINKGRNYSEKEHHLTCYNCHGEVWKAKKKALWWTQNTFFPVLHCLKYLSHFLEKTKNELNYNDCNLIVGLNRAIKNNFTSYQNIKPHILNDFEWNEIVKSRIQQVLNLSSDGMFRNKNKPFIEQKHNYFYVSKYLSDYSMSYEQKYKYLPSTRKFFQIFEFEKVFQLQENYTKCKDCGRMFLKKEKNCYFCSSSRFNYYFKLWHERQ